MKERLENFVKWITGEDVRELRGEWEEQNIMIDKQRETIAKQNTKINSLQLQIHDAEEHHERLYNEVAGLKQQLKEKDEKIAKLQTEHFNEMAVKKKTYLKRNKDLEVEIGELTKKIVEAQEEIKKHKKDLEAKEKQRRETAAKLGGAQTKINSLEEKIEFLKNNRRAPNLEELKDYTLGRKRPTYSRGTAKKVKKDEKIS